MKQDKTQLKLLEIIANNEAFILPKRKNNGMAKELERAVRAGLVKQNTKPTGRGGKKETIYYTITQGGLSKLNGARV